MGDLLVPAWIAENQARERFVDEQIQLGQVWTEVLREELDPHLSVVFITESCHAIGVEDGISYKDPIPGVEPGRWHVRRRNAPPIADTWMPITTPDGGYREPDSGILFELQKRDMSNRTVDDVIADRRRADAILEKQKALEAEQRQFELAEDLRAAFRMTSEDGFTKRKWGRK